MKGVEKDFPGFLGFRIVFAAKNCAQIACRVAKCSVRVTAATYSGINRPKDQLEKFDKQSPFAFCVFN